MTHRQLRRELGVGGAIVTGLGSILGTGVFVSIAVAVGFAGEWVLLAVPAAAAVAVFNGLSSAQLAAVHPVAGGTYEYGYRFLGPRLGFAAGWLFLVAKTASASTAALGFAGFLLGSSDWLVPVAIGGVAAVTALVLSGIRRTAMVNGLLVSVTILGLAVFIVGGFTRATDGGIPLPSASSATVLEAIPFLFVAYTGYGRIATLGEEVVDPERTIPRAVVATLAITAVLYLAVAWALVALERSFGPPSDRGPGVLAEMVGSPLAPLVRVAALVAMGGVLLNLVLGLSRVWLAMGRRADMPAALGGVSESGTPAGAVVVTGALVAAVALVGDVRLTWEFSAFSVLLYYGITNLAALRLERKERRFPRWMAVAGLVSCVFLSFWVQPSVWLAGVGVLAAGMGWHEGRRRLTR